MKVYWRNVKWRNELPNTRTIELRINTPKTVHLPNFDLSYDQRCRKKANIFKKKTNITHVWGPGGVTLSIKNGYGDVKTGTCLTYRFTCLSLYNHSCLVKKTQGCSVYTYILFIIIWRYKYWFVATCHGSTYNLLWWKKKWALPPPLVCYSI